MSPIARPEAQSVFGRSIHRLSVVRQYLLILPWAAFFLQLIILPTQQNLITSLLATLGSFLVFWDGFRIDRLYKYPLSSLIVLGFALTLQLGPSLFTAIEGRPIIFNLSLPVETFVNGFLASIVCLGSHALYRKIAWLNSGRLFIQSLLVRLRIFEPLNSFEVISMGSLGIAALASHVGGQTDVSGSTGYKLIQGLNFLSAVPFAYLLPSLVNSPNRNRVVNPDRRRYWLALAFFAFLILVSVLRNTRASLVVPVACLLLTASLQWLYGLSRFNASSFIALLLSLLLLIPWFADLATAMVMVRAERSETNNIEFISKTFSLLNDRTAIARYRAVNYDPRHDSIWNESYVNNVFLSRFANAKFPDNSLVSYLNMDDSGRAYIVRFHFQRIISVLPGPLLSFLGFSANEKNISNSRSFGDQLFSLAGGGESSIGGFRSGHFFGTGLAAFNYAYLLILFLGLPLFFMLVDAHTILPCLFSNTLPIISVVSFSEALSWFTLSNMESLSSIFTFVIRGFWQPIIVFAVVRFLLGLINPKARYECG